MSARQVDPIISDIVPSCFEPDDDFCDAIEYLEFKYEAINEGVNETLAEQFAMQRMGT